MNNLSLAINESKNISKKYKFSRYLVHNLLKNIQHGCIIVKDPLGIISYGKNASDLQAELVINDLEFYWLVICKGSIGFADAFLMEHAATNNLTNLLLILAKNLSVVKSSESNFLSSIFMLFQTLLYIAMPNNRKNSKQRILSHYDLSNDLFKLFLDKNMSYSSLVFKSNDDTLDLAADYKIQNLLGVLQIDENQKILEIGSGWGALAITAVTEYNCHVTTTTISDEQYDFVKHKIHSMQLENKVKLLNKDYRELTGKYDKLISVEMIEAVGYQYLKQYFKKCSELLEQNGLFVMQCITIKDQEFHRYKKEVDFIKKYIFPGGCLPSLHEVVSIISKHTDFSLLSCHDITYDYAITLKKWREQFLANQQQIYALGFDSYFIRMWDYYFSYCEAGFLNRNIMCLQVVFAKPEYLDPRQNA